MSKVVVDTGTFHFKLGGLRVSIRFGTGIGLFYTTELKIMWERKRFREWKRTMLKLKQRRSYVRVNRRH